MTSVTLKLDYFLHGIDMSFVKTYPSCVESVNLSTRRIDQLHNETVVASDQADPILLPAMTARRRVGRLYHLVISIEKKVLIKESIH